jgi:hypothetical protein
MGIRRSYGKNKKSNRPTEAATVGLEGILRQASKTRGQPGPLQTGTVKLPGRSKRRVRER